MDHKHMLILIIGVASFSVASLVLFLLCCCCQRRRAEDVAGDTEAGFEVKERDNVVVGKEMLVRFEGGEDLSVIDILDAPGEVIGKSSYGTLYRANLLRSNRPALLRFFRPPCTLSLKEVLPIVELLGSIRHPNLLPLFAFYSGPRGEKLFVHSFYRRGNLSQYIRDGNGEVHKWPIICRISMGIARGLDHLHTAYDVPIIHGNLKSKNVLLDSHFQPHVSDFSLHLLLTPAAGQEMLETAAAEGYKVPELIKMRDASEESDIYSFGVILLELLTGKEPVEEYRHPGAKDVIALPNVVKTAIIEDRIEELFHPMVVLGKNNNAKKEVGEDRVLELLRLAMDCCSPSPSLRPTVKEVIARLEDIVR